MIDCSSNVFTGSIISVHKGCQINDGPWRVLEKRAVAHRRYRRPGQASVEGRPQHRLEGQNLLPLVPATPAGRRLHQVAHEGTMSQSCGHHLLLHSGPSCFLSVRQSSVLRGPTAGGGHGRHHRRHDERRPARSLLFLAGEHHLGEPALPLQR